MLNIIKTTGPQELSEFQEKYNPKSWEDYSGNIKQILKKHILDKEQYCNCAYCEVKISDINKAHIEHIKPKSSFPQAFQKYDNLIVSCTTPKLCGNAKGSKYSELFIDPVLENPEEFFTYNLANGEIIPYGTDPDKIARATTTIDILNLNSSRLVNARKNYIKQLQCYDSNYIDEMISNHDRFYTLIKSIKQQNFD